MNNILYLSHARVRETRLVPREELAAAFRDLARQYGATAAAGLSGPKSNSGKHGLRAELAPNS